MASIALWTSLHGDFCIHDPKVHDLASLEQTLQELSPLMPPNMDRLFISPPTFLNESPGTLASLLLSFGFSQIFDYPTQQSPTVLFFSGDTTSSYQSICCAQEASPPPNHLHVDLSAISKNIDTVRSLIGAATRLLVMVKAHGYGTEEAIICRFLQTKGVDIVGVAHVEEALQLRYEGIEQSIFIINVAPHEMEKALLSDAEIGLYTPEQILAAERAAKHAKKALSVHLHIDTGMKRFGAPKEEALELAALIQLQPHLSFKGLFTHFPASDDPSDDKYSQQQINDFQEVVQTLKKNNICPEHIHMSNSAAIFRLPEAVGTMVRLGIALYGYSPTSNISFPGLTPSLTLETTIVGILSGKKGETVSYGRRYTIPHAKMKLAVLPLGYYDGLHRQHSNKQTVLIHGKLAKIVGTICMDYMMVDVTHIPNVRTGDKAILFGTSSDEEHISPLHFAKQGGTVVHELLTCLGPRIRRLFVLKGLE